MSDLEKMSLVELRVAGRKMGVKNVGLLTDTMAGTLMNKSMKKMHDASVKFSKIEIENYIQKR